MDINHRWPFYAHGCIKLCTLIEKKGEQLCVKNEQRSELIHLLQKHFIKAEVKIKYSFHNLYTKSNEKKKRHTNV